MARNSIGFDFGDIFGGEKKKKRSPYPAKPKAPKSNSPQAWRNYAAKLQAWQAKVDEVNAGKVEVTVLKDACRTLRSQLTTTPKAPNAYANIIQAKAKGGAAGGGKLNINKLLGIGGGGS